MPLKQIMKGIPSVSLAAEGIFEHDQEALTSYQQECLTRVGMTVRMEQEAYLTMHPEIKAMLLSFVTKMVHIGKRKEILKEAAIHFTRPDDILNKEIRENLKLSVDEPSYVQKLKCVFEYNDEMIKRDFTEISEKHHTSEILPIPDSPASISNTVSSSFVSIITSNTTLPTPEPVSTPELTLSETLFTLISNTVDKAVFAHVTDDLLRFDMAYVELSKTVEEAMEIPVIKIREDIAELFYTAYSMFEIDIMAKERVAAERAWEKRMRKKMKKTLRRMNNFKGYESSPSTPKSEPSSHESYKVPPPRPCVCYPQNKYNRYPKDRFGIYLPQKLEYSDFNLTVTPAISVESLQDVASEDKVDEKSVISKKIGVPIKNNASKKCTFKMTEE